MLVSASFGTEIARLFSGMSTLSAVLLTVGLILIITEFFRPIKGIGIGCGSAVTACGVTVRMLSDGSVGMLFALLLFIAAILLAAHLLMLALHKREWLIPSLGIVDEEPPPDDEYSYLIGLRGYTTTAVAPSGHMSINDINFYVTSSMPIDSGVEVEVKKVSGAKIIVEPVEPQAPTAWDEDSIER